METYSIIVRNRQGASEGESGLTKAEVNAYLRGWSDPEELTVSVANEVGEIVAEKSYGKKRISW